MVCAIIVAAGKGTRMGPHVDKLFLEAAGRPVVAHTWEGYDRAPEVGHIIVVVREGMQPVYEELAAKFGFRKPFQLIPGGAERQNSVWNGLSALPPGAEIVAIQDGARPCTAAALISATIAAARQFGAAVAAQPVTDTVKESAEGMMVSRTLDRGKLWLAQTPQVFRVEIIRKALAAVFERGAAVTDDTAACEMIGQPVKLISGSTPNPKVTVPSDLPYIELLLRQGR